MYSYARLRKIKPQRGGICSDLTTIGRKNPIQIVEIYHNTRPRATEWRELYAEIALRLDDDLVDALDYGVAVTDSVVPFAGTAQKEAILNNW